MNSILISTKSIKDLDFVGVYEREDAPLDLNENSVIQGNLAYFPEEESYLVYPSNILEIPEEADFYPTSSFVGIPCRVREITSGDTPFLSFGLAVRQSKDITMFVECSMNDNYSALLEYADKISLVVKGNLSFRPPTEQYNKPSVRLNVKRTEFIFPRKPKDQTENTSKTYGKGTASWKSKKSKKSKASANF